MDRKNCLSPALLGLALVAALTSICLQCLPILAQEEVIVRFNGVTTPGIPKLHEHVLSLPTLKEIADKETDINEALFLQRAPGTPFYRASDVNKNQCFYKLDTDWTFKSIPESEVPATAKFESVEAEPREPVSSKLSAKMEVRIDQPPGKRAVATIYRNGVALGSFNSPVASLSDLDYCYFFNGGRSLLMSNFLIRDTAHPKGQRLDYWAFHKPLGDPNSPVVYGIMWVQDKRQCYLTRFDVTKDLAPKAILNLGMNGTTFPYDKEYLDWPNQRLVLVGRKLARDPAERRIRNAAEPTAIIDLKTGNFISRIQLLDNNDGYDVATVPGSNGNKIMVGSQIINVGKGTSEPSLPGMYAISARRFTDDRKYVVYVTAKSGGGLDLTKVNLYDVAAKKVVRSVVLEANRKGASNGIPLTVHDMIFVDKDHLLITIGSQAMYMDHSHEFR